MKNLVIIALFFLPVCLLAEDDIEKMLRERRAALAIPTATPKPTATPQARNEQKTEPRQEPTATARARPTPQAKATPKRPADVTVTGNLELRKLKDGTTYLVIASPKSFSMTVEGEKYESKDIQIAGLSEKEWAKAERFIGKPVSTSGMLMHAHSSYHFTPILVIAKTVKSIQ